MKILLLLSIIALVFLSGCTQKMGDGLHLSLQPDPQTIFAGSATTVHVDISNDDVKTLENVQVELFDTGFLKTGEQGKCMAAYDRIFPNQFETFRCTLFAPSITQNEMNNDISAKLSFTTEFSAAPIMELMTENEYNNRIAAGTYQAKPQSYSYSDKYVQIDVEFSDPMPIVFRSGQRFFVYFTIRNIGNGFIGKIRPEDFYISQRGPIIACEGEDKSHPSKSELEPIGDVFPRLGCEIFPVNDIAYMANYEILIHLKYSYEIRDKATVKIMR